MNRWDRGKLMRKRADEILENIVQLAELLDDEVVEEIADVPFIELAKAVSINRPKSQPVKEEGKGIVPHQSRNRRQDKGRCQM
jgi:hypothetical protein